MIAKCLECSGVIEGDTEQELDANVEHHMLWEHPSNEDVDAVLSALAGAGGYIVSLFAEGRSMEALMALYELEDISRRMRYYMEGNIAP